MIPLILGFLSLFSSAFPLTNPKEQSENPFQPVIQYDLKTTYVSLNDDNCANAKALFDQCKSNPNAESCDFILKFFEDVVCNNNLNTALNQINEKNKYVLIRIGQDATIDLNQLKNKKIVRISTPEADLGYPVTVTINGDIKEKVSLLETYQITVKVINSPLNVENFDLIMTNISSDSQQIQATYMNVDKESHNDIILNRLDKIQVHQYELKTTRGKGDYKIYFEEENWNITNLNDYISIPYKICDKLSLVRVAHNFDLHIKDNSITNVKGINITLVDLNTLYNNPSLDSRLLDDSKYVVNIKTSGDWERITGKVSVFFTSFEDYVDLNPVENPKVEIVKYKYLRDETIKTATPNTPTPTPTAPPVLINDTTSKENNIIEVDITIVDNGIADVNKIQNIFSESKKQATEEDKKKDTVLLIPYDKVELDGLELANDEFIRFNNNADVTLKSGDLNVALDNDAKSVTINVENANDVKLSIKNNEKSTVTIVATSTETVTINSNSELYAPLEIQVPENVKTVNIESINLHDKGTISAKKIGTDKLADLTVTKLTVQPQTEAKLLNVEVTNDFNIAQSASIELSNVKLSKANVKLDLHTYTHSNYEKPMLTGVLGESPESIKVGKPKDSTKPESNDYLLFYFEDNFEKTCESWKSSVNLDDTLFNERECKTGTNNNLKLLGQKGGLFVRLEEPSSKSKLSPGQIAGIAIGCIAAVAIIVVVVVVVVLKKKKNNKNESTDEEIESANP